MIFTSKMLCLTLRLAFVLTFETADRDKTDILFVDCHRINIFAYSCVTYSEKITRFTFFENLTLLINTNIPIPGYCFHKTAVRIKVKIITNKPGYCGKRAMQSD